MNTVLPVGPKAHRAGLARVASATPMTGTGAHLRSNPRDVVPESRNAVATPWLQENELTG